VLAKGGETADNSLGVSCQLIHTAHTESGLTPSWPSATVRVLAVEDDQAYGELLRQMLAGSFNGPFTTETIDRLAEVMPRLARGGIDAILLDLVLPDGDGMEWLRMNRATIHVPVVVLTGEEGDTVAVESLAAGAQDFLVKGQFSPEQLTRAIRYALERMRTAGVIHHHEEQLRQAQKMEAVGRLAGGIAHDFSNLLTVIIGASERVLEALPAESPVRADAEVVRSNCDRAAALTRQILAYSRKQLLQPRSIDPRTLVASTGKLLTQLIGEHIHVAIDAEDDMWPVHADPAQLEQVVMNLALNARDAMPAGGSLTLRLQNRIVDGEFIRDRAPMTTGEYVMLEVVDTGHGMSAETVAHAFEPFFTTKDVTRGTGLGLATVYGIVKQSGGFIWIDSIQGSGTAFSVYLPRALATPELPLIAPEIPIEHLQGTETVLLAEDEGDVRELVQDLLETSGYRVLSAANPMEALSRAAEWKDTIDLLVSDIVMPGGTGHDLARELMMTRPQLKVVLMSGYPEDGSPRGLLLDPGMAFLAKPFTRGMLLRKLREVLG